MTQVTGTSPIQLLQPLLPDGPNFRPNNSKEAPKNSLWREKIGGRKMAEFGKKRLENIFIVI
jgi:hypothetical protein